MSNIFIDDSLLKLATGTFSEWEATTFPIPDGMICYATDTGAARVGNGEDLYSDLFDSFDAIPPALRQLIDDGKIVYAVDGIIPTSYFPKDIFNIHVVVADIEARDALDIEIIRNSQMVVVVDATDDPTVNVGMAFYVAKFSDEHTYTWVKTGEQESIDLDLSQYLKTGETTLNQIADSDDYKRFTQSDLDLLNDALQPTDDYIIELEKHTYWLHDVINDPDLLFYISGFDSNGIVEEKNGAALTITGAAAISNTITRNGKSSIYLPGPAYITSTDVPKLAPLKFGTSDFFFSTWLYITRMDNEYAEISRISRNARNDVGMIFADSGYGHRYQTFIGDTASTTIPRYYATSMVKSNVTLNTWHHYAMCRHAGRVTSFYDGNIILDKDEYNNDTFDMNTITSICIGRGTSNTFVTYFQDFRIYKKPLFTTMFNPLDMDSM